MFSVESKKLTDIKNDILSSNEHVILFDNIKNAPNALFWMAPLGKYPVVRYNLTNMESFGSTINSYINIMNVDYNGKMRLELELITTSNKDRHNHYATNDVATISDIIKIMEKCPKPKGKITLVFNTNYPLDIDKIKKSFDPSTYNIRLIGDGFFGEWFATAGYELVEKDIDMH